MSQSNKDMKRRFNALDVTAVLLVLLVVLGIAGRILLDRRNSQGMETREIGFTCVVEEKESGKITVDSVWKDEQGNKVATVTKLLDTEIFVENDGGRAEKYHRITGVMSVRGYEAKNGVFYSASGIDFRLNTTVTLQNGIQICFYINDIVENGQ